MKFLKTLVCVTLCILSAQIIFGQGNLILKDGSNDVFFNIKIIQENNQEKIEITNASDGESDTSKVALFDDYEFTTFVDLSKIVLSNKWNTIDLTTVENKDRLNQQLFNVYFNWQSTKKTGTIQVLNDEEVAGVIRLSEIPILLGNENLDCNKISQQGNTEGIRSDGEKMIIENISFTISDNYITKIIILGKVNGKTVKITNKNWSLSLKKRKGQRNSFQVGDSVYYFCYSQIFDYFPYEKTGAYNFYVKDAEFNLKLGEEKLLFKRSIDEYLGINIASDFLGLNTGNASNLLTTDFNAVLPLNINQFKRIRWLNYASLELGFTVLNGSNGVNNLRDVYVVKDSTSEMFNELYVDVFDLVRFQNINLDFHVSLLGYELKALNSIYHIGVGMEFYRSGMRHIIELPGRDSTINFNVFSSSPYLKLLMQYRPDLRIGVDFEYKIRRLTLLNLTNDNPFLHLSDGIDKREENTFRELEKNRKFINTFEINLYGKVGNRAGVFARVGIDAIGFKFDKNIFPRITVGYSTNLNAYVNSVNKDSKTGSKD